MATLGERGGEPSHLTMPSESGAAPYRRQLEAVMANATVALFVTDQHQQCTYMNPAAEALTGYTLADVQGRPLHDTFHHSRPDGTPYPREECPIDRALPGQVREQGEEILVHKDGYFYTVAYSASPIRDGQDILGTVLELYDISNREAEEQAILERSRLLAVNAAVGRALALSEPLPVLLNLCVEAVVEHLGAARAAVWLRDRERGQGLTLQASASLGEDPATLVNALPDDLGLVAEVAADRRPRLMNAGPADARHGSAARAAYPLIVEDRLLGVFTIVARQPISEATLDGLASMTTWLAVGIERKQTEIELREQSEVVEAINRIGQMLTSELDLDRLLQAFTDVATELTRAQFGSFFYNVLDERGESYTLFTLSGAPREAFARFPMPRNTAIFSPTFSGEGIVRLDDVTKDPRYGQNAPHRGMPDGHLPVRSYLAVPVVSRSGEVHGGLFFGHAEPGVFTARDERLLTGVAAQAAIAIDNARLYASAREAVRLRDEFLSIASHELRNPVAAIKGAAQLLARLRNGRSTIDEREQRYLGIIERTANRLATLTEDLLDVSRLRRGQLPLRARQLDAAELLRAIVARRQAESTIHELALDIDRRPCDVNADPDRLEQIIENLLSNALKYAPDGGEITVGLALQEDGVLLRVRDTGIGLPANSLERIFEPFGRAPNAVERNVEGLGLGLYICRQIAEQHGGRLWAESPGEGHGTTMLLWLPLADQSNQDPHHAT